VEGRFRHPFQLAKIDGWEVAPVGCLVARVPAQPQQLARFWDCVDSVARHPSDRPQQTPLVVGIHHFVHDDPEENKLMLDSHH
jgi:hypothetical protein